jgi:hypothetical protein
VVGGAVGGCPRLRFNRPSNSSDYFAVSGLKKAAKERKTPPTKSAQYSAIATQLKKKQKANQSIFDNIEAFLSKAISARPKT